MPRGRPRHADLLTPREWQVLSLLRQGLTNAEIAVRLRVSPETVKTHVAQVLSKLDLNSRHEAAEWAAKHEQGRAGWLGQLTDLLRATGSTFGARVIAVVTVGIVAIIATLLILASLSAPAVRESLGKLAYIQNGNLWVKELPDGRPVQLTNDGEAWLPQWSSSGDWLTEGQPGSGGDVVRIVRADGGGERLPFSGGYWSPVDDVFAVPTDRGFRIETTDGTIVYNVDLRAVVRDTKSIDVARRGSPDIFDVSVGISCSVWSPDGQYLACRVVGYRVPPAEGSSAQYSGIWVVSADGSEVREVFGNDPYSDAGGFVSLYGWRRDGGAIGFYLRPAAAAGECQEDGDCSLSDGLAVYEVPPLGGDVRRLEGTLLLHGWLHGRRLDNSSQWPVAEGAGRETWANKRIALIAGSGGLTYVTDSDKAAIQPAWSPDGSQIAYVVGPDIGSIGPVEDGSAGRESYEAQQALARRRIWIMDADGSNKRQLTVDDRYRDERPLWSPDGSQILFSRLEAEGKASVWLMPASGGQPRKVADISRPRAGSSRPQRDSSFDNNFDFYGAVPWYYLYSWWQPH